MPIQGRKSRRQMLAENKAALSFIADAFGKPPPEFLTPEPKQRPRAEPTGTPEGKVNRDIRDLMARLDDVQLWRNNRGEVILPNGGRLRYGVGPNGAADWIGYKSVTITPEMVGRRIAVFTAIEAKAPGKRATDEQARFIDRINEAGGIAGVATSADEAGRIINGD